MTQPLVSVILPCYNAGKFISQSVQSAKNQTYSRIEIIVVDDGSNDDSVEIVRSLEGVLLLGQKRGGACRARNLGLEKCKGDFVKFLDADDILDVDIIRRQVEHAQRLEEDAIVYSDIQYFSELHELKRENIVILSKNKNQDFELLRKNIQTSCPLYPTVVLRKIGGFDERLLRAQEYNLNLRISLMGLRFERCPGIGTYARIHDSPHRISNQLETKEMRENANLRGEIYFKLLNEKYRNGVPNEILRFFFSSAMERLLRHLWHWNFESAARELSGASRIRPSFLAVVCGLGDAVMNVAKYKQRAARLKAARLVKRFFS